jgi:hypothetical protein
MKNVNVTKPEFRGDLLLLKDGQSSKAVLHAPAIC